MKAAAARPAFRPVRKGSVVEDVIEQLKALIGTRQYPPNAKLPSERDMARELGVSVPSLREALRTLAVMGVVDTRHGSGTRVAPASANLFRVPFEFLMRLDPPTIDELVGTRELIEVFLAGRAAETRTAEDLAAMEAALQAMRDAGGDPARAVEADVRFHQAIAAAARNRVLQRMMGCLQDEIRLQMKSAVPGVRDRAAMLDYHAGIVEAIRKRRPEEARRAMKKHMDETALELQRAGARRR
jgi:GntR family transcriptional repressor for pyruvate dehydrogenase complex